MTNTFYKACRYLHAWGGVSIALLFLLSSISGSLLIWKDQLTMMSFPDQNSGFEARPELFATLATKVEEQFDNNDINLITFPRADFPLLKVSLSQSRYAYLSLEGNILAQWRNNERWEEWLYDLHHRLLLEDLGLTIIGLLGIGMCILTLAGIISFWPYRQSFRKGIFPKGTKRTQLLSSHRNLGVILFIPLLMILVTGSTLAFPKQIERYFLEPFRGEEYSMDFNLGVDTVSGENSGAWLPAIKRSLVSFPGAEVRSAQVPKDYSPYRIIGLQQKNELHTGGLSKIYIDANQGWMDLKIDALKQHISERIYNISHPLHTAKINNIFYKILLTAMGISLTILSLIGMVSFIKKYLQ